MEGIELKLQRRNELTDLYEDYYALDQALVQTSNHEGTIIFKDVESGDYRISVVSIIDGYYQDWHSFANDEFEFTLVDDGPGFRAIAYFHPHSFMPFDLEKVWVGGPDIKPIVKIQLYADGFATGDPIILTDGETTYHWDALPVYQDDLSEIKYSVKEVSMFEDYEASYETVYCSMDYPVYLRTSVESRYSWEYICGLRVINTYVEKPLIPLEPVKPEIPEIPEVPQVPEIPETPEIPVIEDVLPPTGVSSNPLWVYGMVFGLGCLILKMSYKRKMN